MDNDEVTADPGNWDGLTPISFSYQWQRCDSHGGSCQALSGKTKQKYTVRSSDEGHTLRVLVTATNSVGSSTALSDPVTVQSRSKPRNTSPPRISGNPVLGQVLAVNQGGWTGTLPIAYSYAWRRCDGNGNNCSTIGGANGSTYKLAAADVGHRLRLRVTARNSVGTNDATSAPSPVIQASAPVNTSLPVIGGTARQGSTLATTAGGWSSAALLTFYYQWARCNSAGGSCAPIPGATRPTYVLTASDVGRRLIVQVKAQNSRGAGYANSRPTAVVTAATPVVSPTSVPVSTVFLPDRLIIDQVQFSPSRIQSRSEPLVARIHLRETTGNKSVSGAYVYAVGVPFDRLSGAGEVRTDSTGWATITFRVLPTFTLRPGNLVVVFVRARKPGGNPLAGISTRRLVSVRVG